MDAANLLQRCRAGEAEAVRDLILQHEKRVFRLALSMLDDPTEADEAAQEVFLAALHGLEGFREQAAFSTWLYRITINICRKRIRRQQARARLTSALQALLLGKNPAPPEEVVIEHEHTNVLLKAVGELEDKHRLPILLFYYHDFTVSEIAQLLSIPDGTVLSRLFTARELLRGKLAALPDVIQGASPCVK